jgi:hypothetical protein
MRRIASIVLSLVIFANTSVYAFDTALINKRSEILEESKKIKSLLTKSQDVILVNSMWDACVLTMTQLDAYFLMVSVFNTIKRKDISKEAVDYLITWLKEIKKTNDVNIKSLNAVSRDLDPNTEVHRAVLKVYYNKLNGEIDSELKKITLLKKSAKGKQE